MRQTVKLSLLEDQGWICCYCNKRISERHHVEHLIPRSGNGAYPGHDIDYANLLACCLQARGRKEERTCGDRKGSHSIPITPLQPECETRFLYLLSGRVSPAATGDAEAETTIAILGLNTANLRKQREGVLQGLQEILEQADDEELRHIRDSYSQRDENGRWEEFCIAITQILGSVLSD